MSIIGSIHDIEALLDDIRSEYESEIDEVAKELKHHEEIIEELSGTISELQEENQNVWQENKFLEAKVAQLELELIEAVTKRV